MILDPKLPRKSCFDKTRFWPSPCDYIFLKNNFELQIVFFMRIYSKNKIFIFFTQNYTFCAFFVSIGCFFIKIWTKTWKKTHFTYSCLGNFLPATLWFVENFKTSKLIYRVIYSFLNTLNCHKISKSNRIFCPIH